MLHKESNNGLELYPSIELSNQIGSTTYDVTKMAIHMYGNQCEQRPTQ